MGRLFGDPRGSKKRKAEERNQTPCRGFPQDTGGGWGKEKNQRSKGKKAARPPSRQLGLVTLMQKKILEEKDFLLRKEDSSEKPSFSRTIKRRGAAAPSPN